MEKKIAKKYADLIVRLIIQLAEKKLCH